MSTMSLTIKDGVHVLTLTNHDQENTFTLAVLQEYLAVFDAVENYQGNTALLITCEHDKTFSTGINLEWLIAQPAQSQKDFVTMLERVLCRLALLPAPTVVCMNGNTYAGGALLAAAADFRVMRADRGRFCFPEVNIKIPFAATMVDILNLLPNKQAIKVMALTGKAYTGIECEALDLVDSIYPADQLQAHAFELAKSLGQKDRATYTTIRNSLRPDVARHRDTLGIK